MRRFSLKSSIGIGAIAATVAASAVLCGCTYTLQVQPTEDEKKIIATYAPDLQNGFEVNGELGSKSMTVTPSADSTEEETLAKEDDAAEGQDASGQDDAADTTFPDTWTPEVNCAGCHGAQLESMEQEGCGAATHSALLGCTDCHADDANLEHAHHNYLTSTKQPTRLKYAFIENDFCLGCHGSWEELAEKTVESTACTDVNGTVVNPHGFPESADHDTIRCINCHRMHEAQDQETLYASAAHTCTLCHHSEEYVPCSTCHLADE